MNLTISMNTVLNFLHSMSLSTSNKRWLADHLYEEVKAEEKATSVSKAKRKLTEKEKDEQFFSVAGAWKDDPIGDEMLEAIQIGRQPASYERKWLISKKMSKRKYLLDTNICIFFLQGKYGIK